MSGMAFAGGPEPGGNESYYGGYGFLIDGNRNNSTFDTQPIEKLPETKNMDNADTLIDFINWGITKYPAKILLLIF
mgnify:CR=1 FL=1